MHKAAIGKEAAGKVNFEGISANWRQRANSLEGQLAVLLNSSKKFPHSFDNLKRRSNYKAIQVFNKYINLVLRNFYLAIVLMTAETFLSAILVSNTPMCADADADAD